MHLYARLDADAMQGPSNQVLACLLPVYFVLAVLMFGVALPAGNFVPGMVLGAALGRLTAGLLSEWDMVDRGAAGVFAVVGSAAVLGSMTHMTLTLTIILVEVTQDIALLPTIMLSLAVARAVGQQLSPSFDDLMMEIKMLPYLEESPPRVLEVLTARDVMAQPVVSLDEVSTVAAVLRVLETTTHNGFPVVCSAATSPRFVRGMILRRQLLVLLDERVWEQHEELPLSDEVREAYVESFNDRHELKIAEINLADDAEALARSIDLRRFMDGSPLTVSAGTPLTRVYNLFNLIGVRHLPVLGEQMQLVGMITRKDTLPELIESKLASAEARAKWQAKREELKRRGSFAGLIDLSSANLSANYNTELGRRLSDSDAGGGGRLGRLCSSSDAGGGAGGRHSGGGFAAVVAAAAAAVPEKMDVTDV